MATTTAPRRGRLKVFLGYASGVGKSYRMLDEARRRKERGEDIIVAAHQPGAQAEIRTLLDKFEIIPTLYTSLGSGLHMDAIRRRKPQVCVIDPLAHNNATGFKNPKRWQDVEELLREGVSVLTAINILHIEELHHRVASLTHRHSNETVPRDFLARADEIVVVDVSTDLVMERTGRNPGLAGPDNSEERNLSQLREMALILSAELAEGQLENYLAAHGLTSTWGTHERILVCVTPHSNGEAMISSGIRNRDRFHGDLHVIHVRQPRASYADRSRVQEFLDLAKSAGAHTQVLDGEDPVNAILEYAHLHKVTQLFVGHSRPQNWLARVWRGPLLRLLERAEHFDLRIFPQ